MDFPTRRALFLRNRSQLSSFHHPLTKKPENDHPPLGGIQVRVNPALPPGTAALVNANGEVTFLTDIAEDGCEICGDPDAESRSESGDSEIWCFACFAEQRPEEAYP